MRAIVVPLLLIVAVAGLTLTAGGHFHTDYAAVTVAVLGLLAAVLL